MLRELRIRNLAVIEDVTISFGPGLNVLTGETGAGKSILIDAIVLLLGGRAQPDLIRSGEEAATVEAVFEVPSSGAAAAVLEAAGHRLHDADLVVKRELARSGRNRVFVNDSAATVGLLDRMGEHLVELHGQHEHQRLLEPARQLDVLDRFAGCEALRERVGDLVREWEAARGELLRLRAEAREQGRQEDLHRFQLSEIDAARLKEGEEDDLRAERRRLQHAERIAGGFQEVLGLLYEDEQAAASRVGRACALLRELSKLDPELGAPTDALEGAQAYVEDAVSRVRALRDRIVFDPGRIEEIDDRLDALVRLKRKYGETAATIMAYRAEVAAALDRLERHDAIEAELTGELDRLAGAAAGEALALAETRAAAASRLEGLVQRELRGLGMEQARFQVALRRETASAEQLAGGPGQWRIGPRGADTAEYLLSANPGEELRPLAKVVSGGELSRAMLALKAILAAADRMPTMVFDEVDAGIGGRVAHVVGQKLRETAVGRQVLCVTHLAPIAAHADSQFVVEKRVAKGRTRTTVTAVEGPARIEELARMLGGEEVTETTRRHARELFRKARMAE
jgi:DNA repair protein RecN (Recombination protein N)